MLAGKPCGPMKVCGDRKGKVGLEKKAAGWLPASSWAGPPPLPHPGMGVPFACPPEIVT